jgi:hypothetical protein
MTPMQLTLFDEFWSLVRKIEVDIREPQPAPDADLNHWWRWELEDAYEAILPLLFSISHLQLFYAPAGQAKTGGPFTAGNTHQAIVYCLTVDANILEFHELLDSLEYKELTAKAVDEVRRLDAMKQIPVARAVLPKVGAMIWDADYETQWVLPLIEPSKDLVLRNLTPTQRRLYDAVDEIPKRGEELSSLADCEFDTARKYVPKLVRNGLIKKCSSGYYRDQ